MQRTEICLSCFISGREIAEMLNFINSNNEISLTVDSCYHFRMVLTIFLCMVINANDVGNKGISA